MSSISVAPSTLDGIKRRARSIKRELGVLHHTALDLAAQQAGFQNIRHAQDRLARHTAVLHPVYLTAYWKERGGDGRETLTVQLPKPLLNILARHQVEHAKGLAFFRLESPDHLERRIDVDSQSQAHQALFDAARTLRFMAATNLRPTTTLKQLRPMEVFQDLPGRDHESHWIDLETGAWVYMDEPYEKPEMDKRSVWALAQRLHLISPTWEGLHNPGVARPHLFCADQAHAARLKEQLGQLQACVSQPVWDGESAPYFSQFISPAREATGKRPRSRSMPAYRGIERNGALPYGAHKGGQESLWRPAVRMPLELHLTIGPLLHSLDTSRVPGRQRRVIGHIRSTLDDWLQMEYPDSNEMSAEQFKAAYYGTYREPIIELDKQIEAVRRVSILLQQGYAECKPQQQMLRKLNAVETALAKALK